jgi:putative ABC transport system permease protein
MIRIEFAPGAARALRALPGVDRRMIAERVRHLQALGLPPGALDPVSPANGSARDRTAWVTVPAGSFLLVCVPFDSDRAVLVAAIERASMSWPALAGALAARPFSQVFRRHAGDDDEQYAAAWPRSAGPWSLRFRTRGKPLMDMRLEIRRAWRSLVREPAVTGLAVATLALGIGLPTAMFSMLNATVLRGLPVENPRDVMHLERRPENASGEGWGVPVRDFLVWQDQQRSFEALAAYTFDNVALRSGSRTDRYDAARITTNTFDLVRSAPLLGRTFGPQDDDPGAPPIIIAFSVWRDRFGAAPDVLGQTVFVDGVAHTVVGVMPERFRFPLQQDLWVPLVLSGDAELRDGLRLEVVGRLRPDASAGSARTEFDVIAARLADQFPETNAGWEVAVKPFTVRYVGETATKTMYVFVAAVMLVLLIACTNVANLLLVRAIHRMRDLAVRVALGAGRWRTVATLLFESSLLAILGGAAGLAVAIAMNGLLTRTLADRMPFWTVFRIDPPVLAFVAITSFLAATLAGLLPALKAMRPNIVSTLKDEARGSTGFQIGRIMQSMIVLQIALSLALLVTTGLLLRANAKVRNVGFGFETGQVFTARVTLPGEWDGGARTRFFDQLEQRLAAEPGARSVALATETPIMRSPQTRFALETSTATRDEDLPVARRAIVSTDFFQTFATNPIRGRVFTSADRDGANPVAIVNQDFANQFFPGADAIGQRIRLGGIQSNQPWRTIVGVVPDLWMGALDASEDRNPPGFYIPLAQAPPADVAIAILARAEPMSLTTRVRDIVFEIDPDLPIHQVRSMDQVITDNSWFYAMGAAIMGVCGLGALLLATIGLYGVVAFSVGKRIREFGIRMAMGADSRSIVRLVLRRGAGELAIGVITGLALATLIARGIESLLFETSTTDPLVLTTVSVTLVAIALVASLIPARRAARTDPLHALRADG